jgi:hypothetical protein
MEGFHFFFSFDFVLPEERPRRLSGRHPGSVAPLAQKPLAAPSFIVQNSAAVVLSDSPSDGIRPGTGDHLRDGAGMGNVLELRFRGHGRRVNTLASTQARH